MLKRLMSQALPGRGRSLRGLFGASLRGAGVEAGRGAGVEAGRGAVLSAAWWLWLSGMPRAAPHVPSAAPRVPSAARGGRHP